MSNSFVLDFVTGTFLWLSRHCVMNNALDTKHSINRCRRKRRSCFNGRTNAIDVQPSGITILPHAAFAYFGLHVSLSWKAKCATMRWWNANMGSHVLPMVVVFSLYCCKLIIELLANGSTKSNQNGFQSQLEKTDPHCYEKAIFEILLRRQHIFPRYYGIHEFSVRSDSHEQLQALDIAGD